MSKSAKRLGRGIRTLISPAASISEIANSASPESALPVSSTGASDKPTASAPEPVPTHKGPMNIKISLIAPNPHQPRHTIPLESVSNLAASIKTNGLLQPVTVRPVKEGRFEIIAGERRWTAIKSLGWQEVPVIVRQASDQEMLELALIENIHREDLNAIERARAYQEFRDRFNVSTEAVAQRLGEDRTTVTNYLRLLDLPDTIQSMVASKQLSMGHARCLLGISDIGQRNKLSETVIHNHLSVRALEEIVRREKTQGSDLSNPAEALSPAASPHLMDMQRKFEESLKTKVLIKEGKKKGTGRITIDFYTFDDFDRVASKLGVNLDA